MNIKLDEELLEQDWKRACKRMAEAMLMITMPEWKYLSEDTKRAFRERLIAHYMEAEYEPRHDAKD